MTLLRISQIPKLNTIVIRQDGEREFFIASPRSIVISISSLAYILKFLVEHDYLDYQVLEGILEEYHSSKGVINGDAL